MSLTERARGIRRDRIGRIAQELGAPRSAWLAAARLTNAQWLAVSVFEDVIDLPGRISMSPTGPLGPGSPARYHVVAGPLIIGAAVGAQITSRVRGNGAAMTVAGACTAGAAVATAFLIGTVNVPLLKGAVTPDRRAPLVRRWHRVNKIRLALLALGALAWERAAARQP